MLFPKKEEEEEGKKSLVRLLQSRSNSSQEGLGADPNYAHSVHFLEKAVDFGLELEDLRLLAEHL